MNNTQKPLDPCRVVTGEARLSYAHLTRPHANNQQQNAKAKYSVTLLIPKQDTATLQRINSAIQAAINDAIPKKWGNVKPPQIPMPVHDGDGVKRDGTAFGPECRGCWVLTASSDDKPNVVDLNRSPIIDESQIYSGMYGRASIRFFGYSNSGNKGIGAGLGNVQKTRDGEPLMSRSTPDEDFADGAPMVGAAPNYAQPQMQGYPQQQPYGGIPGGYPAIPYPMQPQPTGMYQQPPMQGYPMQPAVAMPGGIPGGYTMPQQPVAPVNPVTGMPMVGPVMGIGGDPTMPF